MLIRNPIVDKSKSQPKVDKAESGAEKKEKKSGGLFTVQTSLAPQKAEKTATTRVKAVQDDSVAVSQTIRELFKHYEGHYKLVTTEEELVEYMSTRPELGFDTETTGLNRYLDQLAGFSLGNDNDCIYVPLNHIKGINYQGDRKKLEEILKMNDRKYWGFNSKFDRGFMILHAGFDVPMKWDGELAARLLDNRDSAKLKELYIKYIDSNAVFYEYKSLFKQPFVNYDPAVVGVYAGVDAMKHYIIGKYQEEVLRTHFPKSYKLMKNVELPLIDVVLDMELKGVAIDKPYYEKFAEELRAEMNAKLAEIQKDFPGFNPASPKQVAEVLFDRLRLPDYSKRRATGEEYLKEMNHPVPKAILEYRGLSKALSTYVEAIPNCAIQDKEGNWIVHTTYHTIGADTGRFSSSDPNLQNQPRDNRFRYGFMARPGHKLVSTDFSQQEQAVLAGGSQDPKMLEGAEQGRDYYALMASIVWDLPYESCTKKGEHKKLRNMCKSLVLGVTYGMSAKSLAEKLNSEDPNHHYDEDEANRILKKFYDGFPLVKEFQEECMEFGRTHGYMTTALGRRRYFKYLGRPAFECPEHPEVADTLNNLKYYNQIRACLDEAKAEGIQVIDNRWRQQDEARQTTNHYCQGTAADQTKVCMIAIFRDKDFHEKYHGQLLLQIHDEVITEFPEEFAEEGGKHVAKIMEEVGSQVIGARIWCEPESMIHWQKT